MTDAQGDDWDMNIQRAAHEINYPITPDIASAVNRRLRVQPVHFDAGRLAAGVGMILLIAVLLLAVPSIRAAVFSLLRIGTVEIVPVTATLFPTLGADFFGQATTLADARKRLGGELPMPTLELYGEPKAVYLPDVDLIAATLVYLHDDGSVDFAYSVIRGGYLQKFYPMPSEPIEVDLNGNYGVWLEAPHLLESGQPEDLMFMRHYVSDHVLLWTDGTLTYRLETNVELETAIAIAVSVE